MRMRRIVLSSVAYPDEHYFYNLSHKRQDFHKKKHEMCVRIFLYTVLLKFLTLIWIERRMIKVYVDLNVKYPSCLSDFKETSVFSTDFRKILKCQRGPG